ncbi:hypothetical protein CVT26_010379 [Gymnopilus dilepis]|uniref:Uncharacterized protein n=1 Tax=Gymnopilus dilepis TaxID=231916 RepID=A0A409WZC0_9AGAR|nr:hypothetical protein CVT26_010379 [Gymnopilus dilepis]
MPGQARSISAGNIPFSTIPIPAPHLEAAMANLPAVDSLDSAIHFAQKSTGPHSGEQQPEYALLSGASSDSDHIHPLCSKMGTPLDHEPIRKLAEMHDSKGEDPDREYGKVLTEQNLESNFGLNTSSVDQGH